MQTIKITMIVTKEYVPVPEYYPDGSSVVDMAELDIENCKNDPVLFLETEDADVNVSYQILETSGE